MNVSDFNSKNRAEMVDRIVKKRILTESSWNIESFDTSEKIEEELKRLQNEKEKHLKDDDMPSMYYENVDKHIEELNKKMENFDCECKLNREDNSLLEDIWKDYANENMHKEYTKIIDFKDIPLNRIFICSDYAFEKCVKPIKVSLAHWLYLDPNQYKLLKDFYVLAGDECDFAYLIGTLEKPKYIYDIDLGLSKTRGICKIKNRMGLTESFRSVIRKAIKGGSKRRGIDITHCDLPDLEIAFKESNDWFMKIYRELKANKETPDEVLNKLNVIINGSKNDFRTSKTIDEKRKVVLALDRMISSFMEPDEKEKHFIDYDSNIENRPTINKRTHEIERHLLEESRLPSDPSVDPQFGVPSQKKYPLFDEQHVRSAIKLFGHVDPAYERELARAIIAKMKKYNIPYNSVGPDNRLYKYIPEKFRKEE